jgi:hypothetical protein
LVVAHQSVSWDVPLVTPTKNISGTVYTLGGAPAAGATVKMFRQVDDELVATATTDGAGHYLFVRDIDDTLAYYVLAYQGSSPQYHGVSDRGSVPV